MCSRNESVVFLSPPNCGSLLKEDPTKIGLCSKRDLKGARVHSASCFSWSVGASDLLKISSCLGSWCTLAPYQDTCCRVWWDYECFRRRVHPGMSTEFMNLVLTRLESVHTAAPHLAFLFICLHGGRCCTNLFLESSKCRTRPLATIVCSHRRTHYWYKSEK